MKKLKLSDLKVNSFVVNTKKVKGGAQEPVDTIVKDTGLGCGITVPPGCPNTLAADCTWESECPTSCCPPPSGNRLCYYVDPEKYRN